MAATRSLHHAKPGAATGPPAAVFTPDRRPGRVHCQAMGRCGRLRGTGMNRVADAIVIGSGALGASTAFHLAARGRAVVLVDKSDLASQSSARAAGLAQQVQVDDVLAALAIRGVRTLTSFQALTGQPLDVVVNGSVKVARLEGDATQLAQEVHRGQALGVEIALVSVGAARTVCAVAAWRSGPRDHHPSRRGGSAPLPSLTRRRRARRPA